MPPPVGLRAVTDEDLPIFFEHQADPEASRMAAFPARGRAAFMDHWTRILRDQTVLARTVVFGGQVAGNVVSFVHAGRREVGYWIGRAFWGKGVATGALSAFLRSERERPLYAGVARDNLASIRVLEKCGFAITDEAETSPDGDAEKLLLKLDA